jgi:hypothetical protein
MPAAYSVSRRCAALLALAVMAGCDSSEPDAAAPLVDVGALRAKVSACLGVDAAAAFTVFWPEPLGGVAGARDCVAAARDCVDVLACAGYADPGCSAANDRCDGGTAFACVTLASGLAVAQATACAADRLGNDVCSIADDVKYGVGAFCHGASCTAEHCEGSVIVRCRGGFDVRADCAAEDGKTCAELDGQAFCAYAESCDADRCTGGVIELCNGGRITLRERCDDLIPGTTCTDRMGRVECLATTPSADCASGTDFQSWCESGVAVTCLGGVRAEADCAALPAGACQAHLDDSGSSAICLATGPF